MDGSLPLPPRDLALGLNAPMYGMALQLAMMTGIREWTLAGRKPRRRRGS